MLYRIAARLGISGADLDRNPAYVVRWMLLDDDADDDGSGLASLDDLAALEEQRQRERAEAGGLTDGGT